MSSSSRARDPFDDIFGDDFGVPPSQTSNVRSASQPATSVTSPHGLPSADPSTSPLKAKSTDAVVSATDISTVPHSGASGLHMASSYRDNALYSKGKGQPAGSNGSPLGASLSATSGVSSPLRPPAPLIDSADTRSAALLSPAPSPPPPMPTSLIGSAHASTSSPQEAIAGKGSIASVIVSGSLRHEDGTSGAPHHSLPKIVRSNHSYVKSSSASSPAASNLNLRLQQQQRSGYHSSDEDEGNDAEDTDRLTNARSPSHGRGGRAESLAGGAGGTDTRFTSFESVELRGHAHAHSHSHSHSHGHSHGGGDEDEDPWAASPNNAKSQRARRALLYAIIFCVCFMLLEFITGFIANSIALVNDAVHMLTDVFSLCISLSAVIMSTWAPTVAMSFGYRRAEVIGALASVFTTWMLVVWILVEAGGRIVSITKCAGHTVEEALCEPIDSRLMFGVGLVGLFANIGCLFILLWGGHHGHSHGGLSGSCGGGHDHSHSSHDHDHGHAHSTGGTDHNNHGGNMNLRGAFLHVLGDALQSVGVVVAAALIWIGNEHEYGAPTNNRSYYNLADPFCSILFAIITIFTTRGLIVDVIILLMEGCPKTLAVTAGAPLKTEIEQLDGVVKVKDYHVWLLGTDRSICVCHVVVNKKNVLKLLENEGRRAITTMTNTTVRPAVENTCTVGCGSNHHVTGGGGCGGGSAGAGDACNAVVPKAEDHNHTNGGGGVDCSGNGQCPATVLCTDTACEGGDEIDPVLSGVNKAHEAHMDLVATIKRMAKRSNIDFCSVEVSYQ